jgi:hypothetical protein
MSSAVHLRFEKQIDRKDWAAFCKEQKVFYSPNTVGGNTFYRFGFGGVEIHFGEADYGEAPLTEDGLPPQTMFETDALPSPYPPQPGPGKYNFAARLPPEKAKNITVSSFHGQNLDKIADTAQRIINTFGGKWKADPELDGLMRNGNPHP